MKLSLSPEVLKGLPDPDHQGLIHTTAAIRVGSDGAAELVEVNDMPVAADEGEEDKPNPDDAEASGPMPSPDDMEKALYQK